jgi:hypothetical protein
VSNIPTLQGPILSFLLNIEDLAMKTHTKSACLALMVTFCLPQAYAGVLFSDDFSSNAQNWVLGSTWQIGSATSSGGQNYGNADPSTDHTLTLDNGVAGVVIGGNATASLHDYYYLTSKTIDTSAYTNLSFEFYRWLNSDYAPYMASKVDVFNGNSWVNLFTSGGYPGVQDSSWTLQNFNISSYSNASLQVRFGYNITSGSVFTVSSWNIDDIEISSTQSAPASVSASVPEPAILSLIAIGFAGIRSLKKWPIDYA